MHSDSQSMHLSDVHDAPYASGWGGVGEAGGKRTLGTGGESSANGKPITPMAVCLKQMT